MLFALYIVVYLLMDLVASYRAPTEDERVQLWHEAKNTWPPNWQPESDGIKELYAEREKEIMAIPGGNERWENWLQFTQARLVPKFTPFGFKVIKTPAAVAEKLAKAVADGVADWDNLRSEGKIDVIYHPEVNEPKFVDLHGLDWEVIRDLKELHEEWSGLKLRETSAYGMTPFVRCPLSLPHCPPWINTHSFTPFCFVFYFQGYVCIKMDQVWSCIMIVFLPM